jgi:hypothetical protein
VYRPTAQLGSKRSATHSATDKTPRFDLRYSDAWAAGSLMQLESYLSTTHTSGYRVRQETVVVGIAAELPRQC